VGLDVDGFCRDGYTRLDAAVEADTVDACRRAVWTSLEAVGVLIRDPVTWTQPVVRIRCLDESIVSAERSPALVNSYDTLIGPGRWLPPGGGGDVIPVRFPSERQPSDVGWHVEGNWKGPVEYHTDIRSTGRGLFALLLLTDTGLDDAPMAMMPGSHLAVPEVLEPHAQAGLGGGAIVAALDRTMCRRPCFATGRAGDAYLCHPFLVHTAIWPHRGTGPRMAVVAKVEMNGGFALDGSDTSPVARTIVAGLTASRSSGFRIAASGYGCPF
jgi:hypothetical protein